MNEKLRPLFLVKPKTMSRRDIKRAEQMCGICIAECSEPEAAFYSEPPLGADLDEQARAALSLLRTVLRSPSPSFTRGDITKWFVECLLEGKQPEKVAIAKSK